MDAAQSKQQTEQAENRRQLVGSGDRSERIRTYNFPQGRVTDHRINLTLYKLDEVIEGNLDALVQPLVQEHQADQLQQLADGRAPRAIRLPHRLLTNGVAAKQR